LEQGRKFYTIVLFYSLFGIKDKIPSHVLSDNLYMILENEKFIYFAWNICMGGKKHICPLL